MRGLAPYAQDADSAQRDDPSRSIKPTEEACRALASPRIFPTVARRPPPSQITAGIATLKFCEGRSIVREPQDHTVQGL